MDPNVFETANAGFAQVMYEEFLRDPASVDTEWRQLFESGVVGEAPALNGSGTAARTDAVEPVATADATPALPAAPAVPAPPGAHAHQGSGRTPRAEHEREPHRPDGHDLP